MAQGLVVAQMGSLVSAKVEHMYCGVNIENDGRSGARTDERKNGQTNDRMKLLPENANNERRKDVTNAFIVSKHE